MIEAVIFGFITLIGVVFFAHNIRRILTVIRIGKLNHNPLPKIQRLKHVALFAIGQKKMFEKPFVATLHLIIYGSFFIVNIELLEIILDGFTDQHRSLLGILGDDLYIFLINFYEIFAFLVIIACIFFLCRRNIGHIKRFTDKDLIGFPKRDGNLILVIEIILMICFLFMNGGEYGLKMQGSQVFQHNYLLEGCYISTWLGNYLTLLSETPLYIITKSSWWIHYVGILLFLNYLPYSKHLHILFGFANAYQYGLKPNGKIDNMPSIQVEVQSIIKNLSSESEVDLDTGANDIHQLNRKHLLDAFSCTECGRCSEVCPAHITGKLLSPRKIMMSVRDRAEQLMKKKGSNKKLLHGYISSEELRACTTCQACIEACPILIDPLSVIIQLRRSLVMEEANAPREWNEMFTHTENNFSPWKYAPDERAHWMKSIN